MDSVISAASSLPFSFQASIQPPPAFRLTPLLHKNLQCSCVSQPCQGSGLSLGFHSSLAFNNSSCLFCNATAMASTAIANLCIDFCPSMIVSVIDNEPNLCGLFRCKMSSASAISSRVISLVKSGFLRSSEASAVNSNSNFGQSIRNSDFRIIPESITSPISHPFGSSMLAVTAGIAIESGGLRVVALFQARFRRLHQRLSVSSCHAGSMRPRVVISRLQSASVFGKGSSADSDKRASNRFI